MRLLHTSDLHLGQVLYSKSRLDESEKFLSWLIELIRKESIDVLLISGDIFDTTSPSNRALGQFFDFLDKVCRTTDCSGVVVTGGNHDSPSLLRAPENVLRSLGIHIVSTACTDPGDEALLLNKKDGTPLCIVGAVPFLRDRDVRLSKAGESTSEKEAALLAGVRRHYAAVTERALALQSENPGIPMVLMGHLFAQGGEIHEGEGVRELYIGDLCRVNSDVFDPAFAYVALGHLHRPQRIKGCTEIRYSGSPCPMSFSEAKLSKSVLIAEFDREKLTEVCPVTVPSFLQLVSIEGEFEDIRKKLLELAATDSTAWVDIYHTGSKIYPSLQDKLLEGIEKPKFTILRVRDAAKRAATLRSQHHGESLDDLTPEQVFERRLEKADIGRDSEDYTILRNLFREVLHMYARPEDAE